MRDTPPGFDDTPPRTVGLTAEEKAPALAAYANARISMPEPLAPLPPSGFDQTNPKDLVGDTKVPLDLFPAAGSIYGAMAMKNGAAKFGKFNWRSKKVRLSIYIAALKRHIAAFEDGEDNAPDSGLPHIAHIIANGAILADALEGGNLIDDRPPAGPGAAVLERFREKR